MRRTFNYSAKSPSHSSPLQRRSQIVQHAVSTNTVFARNIRLSTHASIATQVVIQRAHSSSENQLAMSDIAQRNMDAMMATINEHLHERTEIFRRLYIEDAIRSQILPLVHDGHGLSNEIVCPAFMVPRPNYPPETTLVLDLAMVSQVTHCAQLILYPTWATYRDGMTFHLVQLSTLLSIMINAMRERLSSEILRQVDRFVHRDVGATFLMKSIFMESWFIDHVEYKPRLTQIRAFLINAMNDVSIIPPPPVEIAPWNISTAILHGDFAAVFLYLMGCTSLFNAWCPHNYAMVVWMHAFHVNDVFEFGSVDGHLRTAALLFCLLSGLHLDGIFPVAHHPLLHDIRFRANSILTQLRDNAIASILRTADATPSDPELTASASSSSSSTSVDMTGIGATTDILYHVDTPHHDRVFPGWEDAPGPIKMSMELPSSAFAFDLLPPCAHDLPPPSTPPATHAMNVLSNANERFFDVYAENHDDQGLGLSYYDGEF